MTPRTQSRLLLLLIALVALELVLFAEWYGLLWLWLAAVIWLATWEMLLSWASRARDRKAQAQAQLKLRLQATEDKINNLKE